MAGHLFFSGKWESSGLFGMYVLWQPEADTPGGSGEWTLCQVAGERRLPGVKRQMTSSPNHPHLREAPGAAHYESD